MFYSRSDIQMVLGNIIGGFIVILESLTRSGIWRNTNSDSCG